MRRSNSWSGILRTEEGAGERADASPGAAAFTGGEFSAPAFTGQGFNEWVWPIIGEWSVLSQGFAQSLLGSADRPAARLDQSRLQRPDLLFNQRRDALFGQINLAHVNTERAGHLLDGQLLDGVEVKDLILPGVDLLLDLLHCRIQKGLLPLLFPNRVQVKPGRIGNPFHGGSASGFFGASLSHSTGGPPPCASSAVSPALIATPKISLR